MRKLIAIANVVAWGGFWAFGYLALTTDPADAAQMTVAALLAAAGGGAGMLAYLWLVRHAERSGYARTPNRAPRRDDDMNEGMA
jgi:hypothetical protein